MSVMRFYLLILLVIILGGDSFVDEFGNDLKYGEGPGCEFCTEILEDLDNFLAVNQTWHDVDDIAQAVCQLEKAKGNCPKPFYDWQCDQVCYYAVQEFSSEVQFLVIQYIDPNLLCYSIGFNCPVPPPTPEPTPIPDILIDDMIRNDTGIGYILHIPDIHYDPWQRPYTIADCGMPVCCRDTDDNHTYSNRTYAGLYGSYLNCDASYNVITSMWQFIKNNITQTYGKDLDFVIWVGDGVPHDVNNQSRWTHLQILKTLNADLKQTFQDIPVFANLGNHEGMPCDQFEGPGYDDWLLNAMGNEWSDWINTYYSSNDTIWPSEQMSTNGFYTTLIRPGLRLIALHTGYLESQNFYLTWNHDPNRDMASQLAWFKNTLETARALNEKVIVTQHFPLDSIEGSLQQAWYSTYREYSDIITMIFAGHSHSDQYHVFGTFPSNISDTQTQTTHKNAKNTKNMKNMRHRRSKKSRYGSGSDPFAVQFIAGSITTYEGRNPAFRVYSYDRESAQLLDYVQYRFDLEKSNELKEPIWFEAYSMQSEYGVSGISGDDLLQLAENMATNDQLFEKYEFNYNNGYPNNGMNRNATVCHLMSATVTEYNYCRKNVYSSEMSLKELYQTYNKMDSWGH